MLKQLITTIFVTFLATGVFGQTWNCGVAPNQTSVKASLSDGKLTLSGSGAMQDYKSGEARPWEDYKDQITTIEIALANGNISITSIGNYAFSNLKNLKSVEIPSLEKNINYRPSVKVRSATVLLLLQWNCHIVWYLSEMMPSQDVQV